jgi:NADH oxidase (H2O2-forming)
VTTHLVSPILQSIIGLELFCDYPPTDFVFRFHEAKFDSAPGYKDRKRFGLATVLRSRHPNMRLFIVGGGAAGATAAQFARKQDRNAEIVVFEETPYTEYSRCGLPHALSGEIPSFENLIEFSLEWFQRNKIDLRLSTRVTEVDARTHELKAEGKDGTASEHFDSLIIATGAAPSVPRIDGVLMDGRLRDGVFQFRGMDDAKKLKGWCDGGKRKVLVVGAGLVGLEVAEALSKLGHRITVVEYLDSILPLMIDPDMAEPLASAMANAGVKLVTSAAVENILGDEGIEGARIKHRSDESSEVIDCDTIILATGQRPSTSLAQGMGCRAGRGGHILVDARCETSLKGIFAVGDCTEYKDFVTGADVPAGLGTLAVRMGEVAGRNAAGGDSRVHEGFFNARVTRLFGLEIAATGPVTSSISDRTDAVQTRSKGSTLPPYYPGGKDLLVKLTASADDGRILACQIVGEKEAGLRIDVVSSFMLGGLTVGDLARFENAYAPPVSPCVDALAVAAQAILIKLARAKPG